jgi:hypothetical protein
MRLGDNVIEANLAGKESLKRPRIGSNRMKILVEYCRGLAANRGEFV